MKRCIAVIAGLALLGLLAGTAALAQDGHHGRGSGATTEPACELCAARTEETGNLARLSAQLEAAKAAAEEEGADDVVRKLTAAVATIEQRHKALHASAKTHITKAHPGAEAPSCPLCADTAKTSSTGLVNSKCPMMGGEVDQAKTTGNLVREFEGKKVGFCCGGCPAKWDRLTDAQKRERLSKVTATGESPPETGNAGGCCGD